jgi:DNA repair ATPase RecN
LKSINEITNVSGEVELKMEPKIRKMARELTRLLENVSPLEAEAATVCKEMSLHFKNLELCLERLGAISAQIHQQYKKAAPKFTFDHFEKISELYLSLNNTFSEWTEIHKKTRNNFFRNIRMMFKTSSLEENGLMEVTQKLLTNSKDGQSEE